MQKMSLRPTGGTHDALPNPLVRWERTPLPNPHLIKTNYGIYRFCVRIWPRICRKCLCQATKNYCWMSSSNVAFDCIYMQSNATFRRSCQQRGAHSPTYCAEAKFEVTPLMVSVDLKSKVATRRCLYVHA